MDDRRYKKGPLRRAVCQLAGSAAGIGMDIVATDAQVNGVDPHHSPEKAAKLSAQVLWQMFLHSASAGEELLPIANTIVNTDLDVLVRRTQKLAPELGHREVEPVVHTYGQLLAHGIIKPTSVVAAYLEWGDDAFEREPLEAGSHAAEDIIASRDADSRFDNHRAFLDGNPAYHINAGDVPYIADRLSDVIALDADRMSISSLVRHAATTLHLPHPSGNNDDLQFHRVESGLLVSA